jgi:short-subunit dehydrogenase/acyl carrier protein/acyl dehydratase
MNEGIMHFSDFNVGDYVSFKKTFRHQDFDKFSSLSGDNNLLHHDKKYSSSTVFKKPIVPVHLAIAPLSMIAGMIFPGKPSLYLGHEIKATLPIFYNQSISYSAKILDINTVMRILKIKVLAYRESEIVIVAELTVQATENKWDIKDYKKIKNTNKKQWALITGAKGEIGASSVKRLVKDGYSILYHDRKAGLHRNFIKKYIKDNDSKIKFISADLSSPNGHKIICDYIKKNNIEIDVFIHAASSSIKSNIRDLVAVNYMAFRSISDALVPDMLLRQKGRIIFIGSTAVFNMHSQLEDYAAAKSMATNFAGILDKKYKQHGIRTQVLIPGYVETKFSQNIRGDSPALLPEEVASCISNMLLTSGPNIEILDMGIHKSGEIKFIDKDKNINKKDQTLDEKVYSSINKGLNIKQEISFIVMKELELNDINDLDNGALGYTAGWDSLNHIKIILAIENHFSIKFSSEHFEMLASLDKIINTVNNILTDSNN